MGDCCEAVLVEEVDCNEVVLTGSMTTAHLMQLCPLHDGLPRQIWVEEMQGKLYGRVEDLKPSRRISRSEEVVLEVVVRQQSTTKFYLKFSTIIHDKNVG
ncbi:hypothetical protein DPMN_057490 [Dreissena polymorpha]|uniref:Uncharacterized protein n=1 Tax=Dreissena polymorpha TaxID=45954 RepID=A0A9D4C073_DREPO|nr:hypothetical protein DPMN_057490 [Dreissena polymorpha]